MQRDFSSGKKKKKKAGQDVTDAEQSEKEDKFASAREASTENV